MSRLVLPDWPTNPDMEVRIPVRSAILQQAIADHLHTPVTMRTTGPFTHGLMFDLNAADDDVRAAAALYLDPLGIRWRLTASVPILASAE